MISVSTDSYGNKNYTIITISFQNGYFIEIRELLWYSNIKYNFSERTDLMSKKSAKIAVTYFVTIIASLAIIGGAGYFALTSYLNRDTGDTGSIRPSSEEEAPAALSDDYEPTNEDGQTVLAIYEPEKRSTATCFVMARFVPIENKVVIVPLQSDICTTLDGKSNTLYEFYRLGGTSDAKRAAEQSTGIKIDKYIKFTESSFVTFSNFMGNVNYNIPYNLIYENENTGESTIIKSGDQTLDSNSLRKVLSYPNYKGGEEYRAKVVGTLAADLINSGSRGILKDALDTVFTDIVNSDIETDITRYDYDEKKPAIQYVLNNTDAPAQLVIPSGTYNENNCYVLDDTFIQALPRWFYLE